jgi:hypothetical protein
MAGFGYNASVFRDMWIATRTRFEKKVLNTLQREHPLLDKISGKGNFQAKEGGSGKRNVETVMTAPNNNVKYVDFKAEISANTLDVLAQIEWDWKFMYNSFQVWDKVLEMSRTDELVNLLEQYQEATRKGFQEHLAMQLYAFGGESATSTEQNLQMGGLRFLLSDNPYRWKYATAADLNGATTVGTTPTGDVPVLPNIVFNLRRDGQPGDRTIDAQGKITYLPYRREWWRNRIAAFPCTFGQAGSTYDADCKLLVDTMRRMRRVLSNGENGLDGIYCSYDLYEMYINYLDTRRTFYVERRSPDKLDASYSSLEFDGIPIYADKYCPPGRMYFINSDYFHFKYLEGQNFKQEIRQIPFQWAKMYITTFIGNLILTKPHSCGVLYRAGGPVQDTLAVGTVPSSDWAGVFTTFACTALDTTCRYNIANWNHFTDFDYNWIKPAAYPTVGYEETMYSGSGVYTADNFHTTPAGWVPGSTETSSSNSKK